MTTRSTRAIVPGTYFTQNGPYLGRLSDGICTHDEVRQVLQAALPPGSPFRAPLREYFSGTTQSLIVDEIFDGNLVDLQVVSVASAAGIPTTLIGDPWQALYAFRGAKPELVPRLISQLNFVPYPIEESFRFETSEMQALASELRRGDGVSLSAGRSSEVDVVLSPNWKALWDSSDDVLPISFGQAGNRTDAALALLVDHVTAAHVGGASLFGPDATVILGIEPALWRREGPTLLGPVLDRVSDGTEASASAALNLLRETLVELGSPPIRRLAASQEAKRVERLVRLSRRLHVTRHVPGLTIHQAKGREWPHVGVILQPSEHARLRSGLAKDSEIDRALYVALTRARRSAVCV